MIRDCEALRLLVLPGLASEGRDWAIPAAAVAEIVRGEAPIPPSPAAPAWSIGYRDWRGIRVPAVRLGAPGRRETAYLTVCLGATADPAVPFFALETPRLPRLERVGAEDLAEDADPGEREFVLAWMRLRGRPLALADLERIERALCDLGRGD